MQSIKEYLQKLSLKTKKTVAVIAIGTVLIALAGILALKLTTNANYSTLFTGMNQDDAQQVVSLLQSEGVSYQYNERNGSIRVPSAQENETRAKLLSQGYPKSGFTYDMYRDNAGLMTTESDKKQYTLYELQDRLGSQIQLFDGVRDAKVTIAEAGSQKYALDDDSKTDASASIVVTMKDGETLTEKKAAAIKNLVARAVKGMNFTNVSVFDAVNMTEVGGSADGSGSTDSETLLSLVENNIATNIRRVLEKLYGNGNVAVSVKGTLNMERLIQETTQYSTPEKIGEEDKSGLLKQETFAGESSGSTGAGAGGVAGADSNADIPRYTTEGTGAGGTDSYSSSSSDREWLYNSVKEQRQVDPGVLENATVGIVIDTDDKSISERELLRLVANAAGINTEEAGDKITIIRALSAEAKAAQSAPVTAEPVEAEAGLPTSIILAMIAGGVLIFLLLLLLFLGKRKRKKQAGAQELAAAENPSIPEDEGDLEPIKEQAPINFSSLDPALLEQNQEMERNEEILNLRMQHSLKLKQNIGEFIEQNPQIAAKLMQSWLKGEGENKNGGKQNKTNRR